METFELSGTQILNSMPALVELGKLELPAKTAFSVAKITKKVKSLHETLDSVVSELYKKWAEKDEKGEVKFLDDKGTITIPKDNVPLLQKEYDELLKQVSQFQGQKLSISDFESAKVSPQLFVNLDWLITD